MGHVNVHLESENEEILTGMNSIDIDVSKKLLLKDKIGLGIVYHSFDGQLETKESLHKELTSYFKAGNKRINFIQFERIEEVNSKSI